MNLIEGKMTLELIEVTKTNLKFCVDLKCLRIAPNFKLMSIPLRWTLSLESIPSLKGSMSHNGYYTSLLSSYHLALYGYMPLLLEVVNFNPLLIVFLPKENPKY